MMKREKPDLEGPSRTVLALLAGIALVIAGCKPHYRAYTFTTEAGVLRQIRAIWLAQDRPANLSLDAWGDGADLKYNTNIFFLYTNTITVTGVVQRCCFAVRRRDDVWPTGVMVITDNGAVVWIRDRDGKAFLAPDEFGVDP